jgi:hypothetical protein
MIKSIKLKLWRRGFAWLFRRDWYGIRKFGRNYPYMHNEYVTCIDVGAFTLSIHIFK